MSWDYVVDKMVVVLFTEHILQSEIASCSIMSLNGMLWMAIAGIKVESRVNSAIYTNSQKINW